MHVHVWYVASCFLEYQLVDPVSRNNGSKHTVFFEVYSRLSSGIRNGMFPPGSLMPSERAIRNRFAVSRTTVRKCLKALVADGLLECRPRVGYIVKGVEKDVSETASPVVAVIHRDFSGIAYYQPVITLLESLFSNSGYSIVLESSGRNTEKENLCIRRCVRNRVSGLIIIPAVSGTRSSELELWISSGKPAVLQGHPGAWLLPDEYAEACDRVDSDNYAGIESALQYLKSLGHRNIAYISHESGTTSERYKAFKTIIRKSGTDIPENWMLDRLPQGSEGAVQALSLLASPELPTAVICTSDILAIDFIQAFLRCPEDISVMGFGKQTVNTLEPAPRLTTIAESHEKIALELHRLMCKQINGSTDHPETVRIPVHLEIGQTACAPKKE